mmetsp:Transcript_10116/g.14800  ORF Transcript_10116/g.14800 Transcript_10116/m.14800 type:complete len:99 (+) Transcript_10116:46-342(+)
MMILFDGNIRKSRELNFYSPATEKDTGFVGSNHLGRARDAARKKYLGLVRHFLSYHVRKRGIQEEVLLPLERFFAWLFSGPLVCERTTSSSLMNKLLA